ncbi:MAG: VCBS repeat-containing protein [Gemmatimonadales bacterium]
MRTVKGVRPCLMLSLCLVQAACSGSDSAPRQTARAPANDGHLFTMLPSSFTGVRFENRVTDTHDLNVFTYRNFYNGGGVAIGDLTGDGLPEVMLTSNQEGNRLYLNEGHFRFRDVTDVAGVKGKGFWATGVTFADVNGDGLLDIYMCYSGNVEGDKRANELYINRGLNKDGEPTFTEEAAAYGIADKGYSTHAAFFDYDRDGDLDLYVSNNSFRPVSSFGLKNIRNVRSEFGGHKLYRNDGGRFRDVSAEAGIYGSEIAFGLGVAVGDVNGDGWPDIYVSNDFFERDYLYINKKDGTFAEDLEREMPSISYSSMGLDMADINNDGLLDIYVTDMLPADEYRYRMTASFESWDIYQAKLKNDYHHQFTRNMLHLNNGNGTFSEIGQMAGVARTDWSWSALIADYDLDGYKDIHVTNGIARDVTSRDYLTFLASNETMASAMKGGKGVDFMGLVKAMSSTRLPNYAFRNKGDLTFESDGPAWGLDSNGFSNGAAYGDLDGDGAPDLVVNNVNQEAFVYRNNARALLKNHYIQVKLEGEGRNRFAIGAKVTVATGGLSLFQELMPSRGFQSSVDYVLSFGLGERKVVDSVTVVWPDGRVSVRRNTGVDRRLVMRQGDSSTTGKPASAPERRIPILADVTDSVAFPFVHRENAFVDFYREPLIPRMLSTEGPFMAVADVNGDGLADTFIGGAKEQPGRLLVQKRGGGFTSNNDKVFEADQVSEDTGAAFFDANGDGSPDLYVVSGGNEYSDMAPALQDRLYLNDGRGNFRKANDGLPDMSSSGSRVAAADFDGDGDIDVFVGGRNVPGQYGIDPPSVLLVNDGRGHFTDATARLAPDLSRAGMVTDALWQDVDRDGRPDLIVIGEWMPITIFRNRGSGRLERTATRGFEKSDGWWNRIVAGDFTGDGRVDFVVGNLGLNSRYHASEKEPARLYVKDFDGNGFGEQIIACYSDRRSYPLVSRDDLIGSLPYLKARYPSYENYARQTMSDVFPPKDLAGAVVKQAYTFSTALARNNGDGSFTLVPLPREVQISPVYGIIATDADKDGKLDLLVAGNFDGVKPETGRMSAGYGLLLRGDGKGGFSPVATPESGFFVPGQARDIQRLPTPAGDLYVVTRNNDRPLVFRLNHRVPPT